MKKIWKYLIPILFGLALAGTAYGVSVFNSQQLAPSPQNGNCLTTNGANPGVNAWSSCGSGGGGSSATTTINGLSAVNYTFTGSGVTIATSAPGTVTFTVTGGSSVSTSSVQSIMLPLIANGTVAGVNATSSVTSFLVQGTDGLNPFAVSSSTGTNLLTVTQAGRLGIGSANPGQLLSVGNDNFTVDSNGNINGNNFIVGNEIDGTSGNQLTLSAQNFFIAQTMAAIPGGLFNSSGNSYGLSIRPSIHQSGSASYTALNVAPTQSTLGSGANYLMEVKIGSGTDNLSVTNTNKIGINTSTPAYSLDVYGTGTTSPFNVSSSSNVSLFQVTANGNVNVATLTASSLVMSDANKNLQSVLLGTNLSFSGNTLNATGGGSGNSAWTIGNGLIYNATSTDLVGIGTITPTTTLFVQGKSAVNPFAIASSTGTQLLTVTQAGNVGIGSTTPGSKLVLQGTAGSAIPLLTVASSSGVNLLTVSDVPTTVAGLVLNVASSTNGTSLLSTDGFGRTLTYGGVFAAGNTPTIATSTGAGTAGTASITGVWPDFQVTVNALTSPGTSAVIFTVTPPNNIVAPNKLICIPFASNGSAAALSGTTQVFASSTASQIALVSGSAALSTGTTYTWFIRCGGY